MADFAYAGTTPHTYSETRDADGNAVGTVAYGDVRPFAEPPDDEWLSAAQPLPKRLPDEPGGKPQETAAKLPALRPATPPATVTPAGDGQKAEG